MGADEFLADGDASREEISLRLLDPRAEEVVD